ncbi:elongation of very long chain fatty acids protein 6-like protein [Dinothrombium tinctorium]|uniref:Elongation of very long chain fatty acids protein n=1 Tax=Dinothrombium tinctorium TaxID=1965070 RepID=A0A443R956_9ACAR|nr:elongation of very long chain fatty acids protein 6-like protein [Dinothrombium tinctorium]
MSIAYHCKWANRLSALFTFSAEEKFDYRFHRKWLDSYWYISVLIAIVYVCCIFLGQEWMKRRKAFNLRKPLAVWNASLAAFSMCGTIRMVPELLCVIITKGFFASICNNSYVNDVRIQFWLWLFTWSKVVELGDTIFIVLRKQKLIALHWIHHTLTLISCFYVFGEMAASARWFASMNYVVHSYMYAYYSLKALQIRVPRCISMVITCSQIAQMITGLFINYLTSRMKINGTPCQISMETSRIGFSLYLIFSCLFLNFFIGTYISRPMTLKISVTSGSKSILDS